MNRDIFVADNSARKIMKSTGNSLLSFTCVVGCTGSRGIAANQFANTRDLKFDQEGNLYVVDQSNNRIQKFSIQSSSSCLSSKSISV